MKKTTSNHSSHRFPIAAAIACVLGTMPLSAAHAGNMRTKQATRVAPALAATAGGAGTISQVSKRTPLHLGRTQRATAKVQMAQRAEVASAAKQARAKREHNDVRLMVRVMGGTIAGGILGGLTLKAAESFGLDASFVSSLSPTTGFLVATAAKAVFGVVALGTGALFYQAGMRKIAAEEAAAATAAP